MAWQFAPGEILTATNLNAVTIPWNARALVSTTTGNTLASGSVISITWETETLDPRGWFTASTTVITPNIAGYYRTIVRGAVAIDASCTRFFVAVRRNAVDMHAFDMRPVAASGTASVFGAAPALLMNGSSDTLSIRALQSGSASGTFVGSFEVELVYPT